MAVVVINISLAFVFGILGNLISFMVFLSPIPTFYKIFKKKCTEGFQSLPYVISLFSCMLWIYYALLKRDTMMLITINTVGAVIEIVYITIHLLYSPKEIMLSTVRLLFLLNFGAFSLIVVVTMFLASGEERVEILGWFCVAFSCSVFAAPLCVIRNVIRTKCVDFMPFSLSFCLTISAIAWFLYGVLIKDLCVALPNVLGFGFGVVQMVVYAIYMKKDRGAMLEQEARNGLQLPEHIIEVIKLGEGGDVKEKAVLNCGDLKTDPDSRC